MEKHSTTPTSSGGGAHGAFRKGSGGSILGAASSDITDQLNADQDPEYRKNFLNRKKIGMNFPWQN